MSINEHIPFWRRPGEVPGIVPQAKEVVLEDQSTARCCLNCQYWNCGAFGKKVWGMCQKVVTRNGNPVNAPTLAMMQSDRPDADIALRTHNSFCCVQFSPVPELMEGEVIEEAVLDQVYLDLPSREQRVTGSTIKTMKSANVEGDDDE